MQTAQIELRSTGLFADLVAKIAGQLRVFMARAALQARIKQERKQLLEMPEYLLKDMGISKWQAMEEAARHDLPTGRC